MELELTQASSNQCLRKRVRVTNSSDSGVAENETQDKPRVAAARKRRAVEHPDTGTPVREQRVRRSAVRSDSTSAQAPGIGSSTSFKAPLRSTAAATLSHEDPVPADCCFVCRRRGGNYAYTCVYDDGSEACKRCIKEKYKCRPATAAEIAKAEARCPQCKSRGLTNCWYEDGKTSCEPCLKWKKQCGASTKRILNANTRSFLGIPTPEPEQHAATTTDRDMVDEKSCSTLTNTDPRHASLPASPHDTLLSRSQRPTRRSAAATVPLGNEAKHAPIRIKQTTSAEGQDPIQDQSKDRRTSTRFSRTVTIHDGRDNNEITPEPGAALLKNALVRSSGRRSKASTLLSKIQETTPDDSAEEETGSLAIDVNMADIESVDLQLLTENSNAIQPSPSPAAETEVQYDNTAHVASSDNDSSDDEVLTSQRRALVADQQASRPRRSSGRPSYAEFAPSDVSDQEDEDGEDEWDLPDTQDESEVDDDVEEFGVALEGSSDGGGCYEDLKSVNIEPEPMYASRRRSQLNSTSAPKQGKGIDLNLPPLDNVYDIIADMTSKAVELGLCGALQNLKGGTINVATMCSGTESPLLFLQMLAEALDSRGETSLHIKHHFSAEIDATKQAYIERNFHPPILFRDVRQLGDETAITASTAYGAEEVIPGNLDILIAGFVCKDLSSLNSRKKTVDDQGETGDTWRAIYFYVRRFQPSIVLLENVKSDKRLWDDVVSRWSKIGYEAAWVYCDTKNYYLPQTRERMYMIAINRKLYGENVSKAVAQWQSTMEKLQRQCSSPYEAFLVDLPVSVMDYSPLSSEPDWSLCKLRYDQIRSEQRLGTRRPITQWNESGILHPPDYANRRWYDSQSSRVYDAIDVAHLQAAQEGYDSMYKMKIWDVSQNVDRFKTGMGLMPCVTPGGCDFASNRQDALNGSQTLVLQGMPLDKLHFAGETQRECQNLAGNAMSTTVIGASLISAIIHGYKAFRSDLSANVLDSHSQTKSQMQNRLVRASALVEYKCRPTPPEDIDVVQLLHEARLASRLCSCEGNRQISEMAIKMCSGCGHTTCTMCASNPRHQYVDSIPRHAREQTPDDFVRSWKPRLPPRLRLKNFPNLNKRLSQLRKEQNSNEAYVRRVVEADISLQQFSLSEFVRCDNEWSKDLPAQVSNLQTMDLSDFTHATQDLLERRLQQPKFQATLPLRLQHGSNYQSYEAMRAAGSQKTSGKPKLSVRRKSSGSSNKIVPLMHMFRFNRIVVDEYHYLNDFRKIKNMFTAISLKKITAHKRWILSGTPSLANFTDIDNVASFLGVRLGRFAIGSDRLTPLESFLVENQTAVERFLSKTEVMSHQWHQARHERAQEFLDLFVRQNEASLEHVPCHEELRAVDLDVAHHAVYLELSQHLICQRMQVKRLRNKAESDRISRLNASLNNSKTAEDALLKAALLYETSAGESGLDTLVHKRTEQRQEAKDEILRLMRAFEWHKRTGFKALKPIDLKKAEKEENTIPKLYASFTQDVKRNTWLGDDDAMMNARQLLKKAEAHPIVGGLEELKEVSKEKMIKEAKTIMSHLRESCVELALRTRSERFITTVQQLLRPLCEDSKDPIPCDAKHCQGKATVSEMYLASQCGHLTCEPCILARGDDENCVMPGCSCTVQAVTLIKATDLGSTRENAAVHSFGRKMNGIAKLIKKFPSDDQGLVFAPNDEMIAMLGEVLNYHDLPYYTPSGCNSRQAAKIIEEFKASADEDQEDRPKVLLLNLTSETAAGVNLTNANHIIFISPLLVESQYKYDSAMTQAIARSRRYGQEKKVHIYHFAALRTIDVDILEHRHKRTNGITAAKSTARMTSKSLATRKKTRLVKNNEGSVALVPISWLADEKVRKGLGVEKKPEKFTSLINFSETFEDGAE